MEKRYILGVDAGATKTHYALYDLKEDRLELVTGRSANHETLDGGYDELFEVLKENLGTLLGRWNITPAEVCGAGLGMGGVDTRRQHDIIHAMYERLGFTNIALANDGILGIKAECATGSGICAVNGTGFSVFGMAPSGKWMQIGGLAEWTGDCGGGGYLVHHVISCVYHDLFKNGNKTSMTRRVMALLGIDDANDFIETLSVQLEEGDVRELTKDLSILLHECAEEGDAEARKILAVCGKEYADSIDSILRNLPELTEEPLEIILVGSNFVRSKCSLAKDTIIEDISGRWPELKFTVRPIATEPVVGALFWGAQVAGIPTGSIPKDKIIKRLKAVMN